MLREIRHKNAQHCSDGLGQPDAASSWARAEAHVPAAGSGGLAVCSLRLLPSGRPLSDLKPSEDLIKLSEATMQHSRSLSCNLWPIFAQVLPPGLSALIVLRAGLQLPLPLLAGTSLLGLVRLADYGQADTA